VHPRILAAALSLILTVAGLSPTAQAQDGPLPQAIGMLQVDDASAEVMQKARASVAGADREGKDGPLAAVGMELAVLYYQHRAAGPKGVQALRTATDARPKTDVNARRGAQSRTLSPLSADGRFVVVEAVASNDPARLLQELRGLGLEGGATAGNVVSGRLPIEAIKQAAALPSLRAMMPSYVRTHVGSVGSEADTSHRAVQARATFGVDGSGQKVCALSNSYNQSNSASTTATDDVQSGDLPGTGNPEGNTTPVDVLDDSDTDGTDEGRAMLQLIHDIAPGAALGFHTATAGGLGVFASGIRDLSDAGCTVIVDDVRFNTEPFYQDGPVSNAVDDVVNNDQVTYFSSAGNDGLNTYEAPFRNSGEPGVLSQSSLAHDFNGENGALPPTDTRQAITIIPGSTFQIFSFQWTDPSAQVEGSSGPDTDIDIALVDESGNVVAESSTGNAAVPVESLEYTNSGDSEVTLDLVIEKASGPDPDEIKYVYSATDPDPSDDNVTRIEEYDTGGPTIYGHPMAEGAMAVAAAPFFNTARYNPGIDSSAILNFYSSKGGLQIRFDQNGTPVDPPQPREKPDVTGTDFIDNTFFGTDINIADGDPFPNFSGTSAAAPNIAAIAALIQQADLSLSPTEVYDRLESTAVDIQFRQQLENGSISSELDPTGEGVDPWSGHGFVRADRAVPAPAGVQIANVVAKRASSNNQALEVTWQKVGTESVDEFVLEKRFFNGAFAEQERFSAGSSTDFSRIVEDLPFGEHTFRITALRNDSTVATGTASAVLRNEGVDVAVYPNPFSDQANLSVTLPADAQEKRQQVTVRVYDILGRRVATPVRSRSINVSESISLNSREIRSLSSGVYFFRVTGATFQQTARGVRVR
jgi:hypothetical protein